MSFIQTRVQEKVSVLKTAEGAMMTAPAIFFSLFAGAYSDRRGRRLLIALPFLGNILSYLAMAANLHWWEELRAEYLLISGVAGLTGGYVCFNIGVYSYMADITTSTTRTYRMSILNGIFSLGFVGGISLGSRITQYWIVFLLSSLFGSLGLLYTLLVLREPRDVTEGTEGKISALLDCSHIRDCARTAFGRRDSGGHRAFVLVLLAAFLSLALCLNTGDFDYLMTRLKFGWEASEWSFYLIVQRVTRLVSLLLILPFLSCLFGLSDNLIIIFGLSVTLLSYTLLSITTQAWMVYMSAMLQMNSITTVSIRSKLSKLVESNEIGKIFAVVGVGQSAVALLSQSAFGAVYRLTLSSFPTAYILIVIIALATSLAAFILLVVTTTSSIMTNQHLQEDSLPAEVLSDRSRHNNIDNTVQT